MDLSNLPEVLRSAVLRKGAVLKMDMTREDGITPKHGDSKEKRFVILSIDDGRLVAASLIINSDINNNLFFRIGPYQHLISASDYDFLDHDSYIDGFTLHEFKTERIIADAQFLGTICDKDIQESVDHLIDSGNVKPAVLKRFGLSHKQL